MSKMQEQREEKARRRAELDGLLRKVPPAYSDWTWDRTHDFIEAQRQGARARSSPKMAEAIRRLTQFWG